MTTAYPLQWPAGWPRNQSPQPAAFKVSLARARDDLLRELDLLGATGVVVSSNALLLRNGQLAGRQPRIDDTGVVVYFVLDGHHSAIPCDRWLRIEDNVRAIGLTVAALRGLDRWGAKETVAAAFQGFQALPASTGNGGWWAVLAVRPNATAGEVDAAYRSLARVYHPDAGGDAEMFRAITEARRQGLAATGG